MGQFLAIGLVTEIAISKKDVESAKLTKEQLLQEMTSQIHFLPEIYNINESDKYFNFNLLDKILYSQLIPFLEKFYPKIYSKEDYYKSIIESLKNKPNSEWLEWAKEKPEEAFQFDEYGTRDYLTIKYDNIAINYDAILLSMEGKIGMEVYGRQFNFFKYCMIQAFNEFSLASALRIYITG